MSNDRAMSSETRFWTVTALLVAVASMLIGYRQLVESRKSSSHESNALSARSTNSEGNSQSTMGPNDPDSVVIDPPVITRSIAFSDTPSRYAVFKGVPAQSVDILDASTLKPLPDHIVSGLLITIYDTENESKWKSTEKNFEIDCGRGLERTNEFNAFAIDGSKIIHRVKTGIFSPVSTEGAYPHFVRFVCMEPHERDAIKKTERFWGYGKAGLLPIDIQRKIREEEQFGIFFNRWFPEKH